MAVVAAVLGACGADDDFLVNAGNAPAAPAPQPDDSPSSVATAETCIDDPDDMNTCCSKCVMIHKCDPSIALDACIARCETSNWSFIHRDHCLATSIGWIDEEGCESMLTVWDNFKYSELCL